MPKLYTLLAISAALQLAVHSAPLTTGICNTPQCLNSATGILKDMNPSADPCIDFSQFACGGFYEREVLRDGEKKNGYLTSIEQQNKEVLRMIVAANDPKAPVVDKSDPATERNLQKLQTFYSACMDNSYLQKIGREPLQAEIRKMVEIYPISTSNSTGHNVDTTENYENDRIALSRLLGYNMKYGFENPFVFELWDDETAPGYKIMTIQQSGMGLEEDSPYSDDIIIQAYEKIIGEMFYFIQGGGDPSSSQTSIPEVWKQVAKDVLAFEKILAGVIVPETEPTEVKPESEVPEEGPEEELEEEEEFTIVWDTIADLDAMTPAVDWTVILTTAFPKDTSIPTKVNMLWKFYLRRMNTAFQVSSPETIQNYFAWTMMRNLGKHLAEPFQRPLYDLKRLLPDGNKQSDVPERWRTCVEMVNENLGDMAGHFFVKATFPGHSQNQVNDMIKSIRWSFEKNFWQYDWLDQRTRQEALQKLKAITQKVGYSTANPDVMSSASVEEFYHALEIRDKDHFGNQVRSSAWKMENMLRSVSQPENRIKLESIPQTVNAFYNPTKNSIEILAGMLQPPFYHIENPEYLNFAGIGAVAAHELGHAFDNRGRSYDETGTLRDWWTESSAAAFEEKSKCFIDQYSEYTVKGPDGTDHFVNAWGTLGENIADNGGLKLAYESWRQRYRSDRAGRKYNNGHLPGLESRTAEQLFFIQFARSFCGNIAPDEEVRRLKDDSHSPRKYRINGVVQNSDYFAQAFQCKSGTPMNPTKKCILW